MSHPSTLVLDAPSAPCRRGLVLFGGILAVAAIAAAAGCGGSQSFKFAPVSGQVTLDGNPVADVGVSFQPQGGKNPGPGSSATTGADGRYTLMVADGSKQKGAVVGKHAVRLSNPMIPTNPSDPDSPSKQKLIIPAKVTNDSTSFDVPAGGTDKADFALKSR